MQFLNWLINVFLMGDIRSLGLEYFFVGYRRWLLSGLTNNSQHYTEWHLINFSL